MSRYSLVAASLVGLSALVGCEQRNQLAKMPPPTVTVARPVKEDVVDYVEFTGVTRAAARVELRARVKGMLIEIRFKDGAIVQKGDLLFVIDPKPYVNAQKSAAATLQKAQASLGLAEQQLARTKELLARNATSQEALDSQNAQRAVALADVASAEAALKTADLNLGYTEVRAPLTGRISENLVDVGNLVQAETTVLAHIESVDPMQAYFTVSERDVARLAEANARAAGELSTPDTTPSEPPTDSPKTNAEEDPAKKATSEVDPPMPVVSKAATDAKAGAGTSETDELVDVSEAGSADDGVRVSQTQVSMALGDTGKYEFEGRLDYEEFGVDAGTGTVMRRALFKNADGRLIPGLFVRIRMALGPAAPKLLVEDRAIVADQRGEYLLVVGKDNIVENRPVKIGSLHGTLRVIEDGVKLEDRVVVNGVQRARPSMPVTPRFEGEPDPNAKPPAGAATAQASGGHGAPAASSPAGTGTTAGTGTAATPAGTGVGSAPAAPAAVQQSAAPAGERAGSGKGA